MKRKHRNTTRLTARERAMQIAKETPNKWITVHPDGRLYTLDMAGLRIAIERALQAHARQALVRAKVRR
jgi:hypothetical protein